jgi:hypothetical protein
LSQLVSAPCSNPLPPLPSMHTRTRTCTIFTPAPASISPPSPLRSFPAVENLNTKEYLAKCRNTILENLRYLEAAPGVAFQDVPPDWAVRETENELRAGGGSLDPDVRPGAPGSNGGGIANGVAGIMRDGRREHESEFYDGEHDQDAGRGEGRGEVGGGEPLGAEAGSSAAVGGEAAGSDGAQGSSGEMEEIR